MPQVKVFIQSWSKPDWVSYIVGEKHPDKDTTRLCEFEGAKFITLPNGSYLSDFFKKEFNVSKSEFRRKVSEGALERLVFWMGSVRGSEWRKVTQDFKLDYGIESYRYGKGLFIDLWVYKDASSSHNN